MSHPSPHHRVPVRVAHRVGLPIVGATRRVAHNGRGTVCPAHPAVPVRVGATRCVNHRVQHPSRASPIASGRPGGSPTMVGARHAVPLHTVPPHAVPYPNHHHTTACRCASGRRGASTIACVAHRVGATRRVAHNGRGTVCRTPTGRTPTPTTACRCASPIAPRRPSRRVAPTYRTPPQAVPCPTHHPTTAYRCASPIAPRRPSHRVAHRVGLPIVGATRRVAPTYRTPPTGRTVSHPSPHHRVPVRVAHCTASPIASGRPDGSPKMVGARQAVAPTYRTPPQAVPYPNHHPTTACRCASPRSRSRRPSRRGGPARRPKWSGHGMPCPYRPYRVPPITPPPRAGARRPLHRVAHRVGLPIGSGCPS
ncbi:MAG: hypothetical protein KatS3mg055_0011 [Chloroflexus sp.]|nr:MAG: hypothetical protein KatS3mg055_0011 [Chloroflexus sp.]